MDEVQKNRTSGPIEAWNYIIKQCDHKEHRLRPDIFLSRHFTVLLGRQITFLDTLPRPCKTRVKVMLHCLCIHVAPLQLHMHNNYIEAAFKTYSTID